MRIFKEKSLRLSLIYDYYQLKRYFHDEGSLDFVYFFEYYLFITIYHFNLHFLTKSVWTPD